MDKDSSKEETLICPTETPTEIVPQAPTGVAGRPARAPIERTHEVLEVRGGRGVSGMGVVYIVEEEGQRFAVKTFQRRFGQNLAYLQRFIREAKTWMLIGFHPNIAHAYRLDIIDAIPHLFVEYVPSDAHGRHALSHYLRSGPLPVDRVLALAAQFCDGMIHATGAVANLVHRDIKPDNLLITPEGCLKITDFGLVRSNNTPELPLLHELGEEDADHLTQAGAVFGTPAFMAPEQFDGAGEVTAAADMYSFGCCLYVALTGTPPFSAAGSSTHERLMNLKRKHLVTAPIPLAARIEDCPPALDALVMRCLAKEPGERWADFTAFKESINETCSKILGAVPVPARRSDPMPRLVAEQLRSLSLLDGYEKAIRLRNLREGQEGSPYSFHLALGSYFHFQNDPPEEERQLRKALDALSGEDGYEATRRLAELLLERDQRDEADRVIEAYLARNPGGAIHVLEPLVHLQCGRGQCGEIEALLSKAGESMRTQLLRAKLLRTAKRFPELAALLHSMAASLLDNIEAKLAMLRPGDTPAWGRADDWHVLASVLTGLRPDSDCHMLDKVSHAVWPELRGYPDFAPEMAWLSQVLGELAELESESSAEECNRHMEYASFLGYPSRLTRHLERDEAWFWREGIHRHG